MFVNLFSPLFFAFAAHPIVHVNALLNGLAGVLLVVGYLLIKQRREVAHKRVMLAAFVTSIAFLGCYLWYHFQVAHVAFTHPGAVKYVYYAILLTHILLAMTVPFLAVWQIYLGYKAIGCCGGAAIDTADYRRRHRRSARWTLPIWLYVSVTGIVVYVMLYHLWPPVEEAVKIVGQ